MSGLKKGETVKIKNGSVARVLDEFGSGGQGTVYRVSYEGKEYALKWYHIGVFKGKEQEFYQNLENNISKGAPTKAFLWPLGITEKQNGSFGYLMDIRPGGYDELTDFFVGTKKKPQVHFASFAAIITAAINIIQAFRELHNRGYSYQDINNGNFFINPNTGDVLICDNDNVSPYGTNLGIMGKQRWMAPEIVTGGDPDKHSDRFSLAVVLFRLLFINHPLEGAYSTPPCMTKELERKYYGTDPIFIYDPNNAKNRPIQGTDHNLKVFWNAYPQYIRDAFIRAFSNDVMMKKAPRIIEKEWLDLFFRLRAETVICPHCKGETFFDVGAAQSTCIECRKQISRPALLETAHFKLPIHDKLRVYLWHIDSSRDDIESVVGEVIRNPNDPNLLGFRNTSSLTWKVKLPDGSERPLPPNNVVPSKDKFEIDFLGGKQTSGTITY